MKSCPHCHAEAIREWKLYWSPHRIICPDCGGRCRAAMGPESLLGRGIYLAAASLFLVFVFTQFGRAGPLFWPVFISVLPVSIGFQFYCSYKLPLRALPPELAGFRARGAWVASREGRKELLRVFLLIGGCVGWLFALQRIAILLR